MYTDYTLVVYLSLMGIDTNQFVYEPTAYMHTFLNFVTCTLRNSKTTNL